MEKGKCVTIADVARAANVSRTLVSFVLNGRTDVSSTTRTRILQAIEELGYRPNAVARNLARRRAGAIGKMMTLSARLFSYLGWNGVSIEKQGKMRIKRFWRVEKDVVIFVRRQAFLKIEYY